MDGHFLDEKRAKLPIRDRGFRYGDGVFETIAAYRGIPYQWELHHERLVQGLAALSINCETKSLEMIALKLLKKNAMPDATVRISVSRGVGSQGYLPVGSADATVIIETALRQVPPPDASSLWLSEIEKPSPKALPVQHKTAQGLNSILVRMQAAEHGCLDGLQLNAAQEICEASSANIFWLKGKTLFTPSLACGVLAGTTRAAIKRISPYKVEEGRFTLGDLEGADAVVLTNCNMQVMPVSELLPLSWDFDGSVTLAKELRALFMQDVMGYVLKRTT